MRIFCIIYNVELQASAKKLGGERGKKKKGVLVPGILLFNNRGITDRCKPSTQKQVSQFPQHQVSIPPALPGPSLPVATKCMLYAAAWNKGDKYSPDRVPCFPAAFKKELKR